MCFIPYLKSHCCKKKIILIFKPQISKTQENVPESVCVYIYIYLFIFYIYIYLPTFKVRSIFSSNSFSKQRIVDEKQNKTKR